MEICETAVIFTLNAQFIFWGSSFAVDGSRAKELSDSFALVSDLKRDGTFSGGLLTENFKE